MRAASQAGLGMLAAVGSLALVVGAFLLAFVESGSYLALRPQPTSTATFTLGPRPVVATSRPGEPTFTASPTVPAPPTPTFPPPSSCPPPPGWVAVSVTADDTLGSLAARYNLTPEALAESNCLPLISRLPDGFLYVPPPPTATFTITPLPSATATPPPPPTATVIACGPFPGWVRYTVQPGDTLFSLAVRLGVTVQQLRQANCLGSSSLIRSGQALYVPFLPPPPPALPTLAPTLALPPTLTPFVPSPTLRPTSTPLPPTNTPVPPSSTPLPPTATPLPPSSTPLPPTATPLPPSSTPLPPTATPAPPTDPPPQPTSAPPTSATPQPVNTAPPGATSTPGS